MTIGSQQPTRLAFLPRLILVNSKNTRELGPPDRCCSMQAWFEQVHCTARTATNLLGVQLLLLLLLDIGLSNSDVCVAHNIISTCIVGE